MNKVLPCLILAAAVQLSANNNAHAQGTKTGLSTLQAPSATINIDGDLKDWGDSLRYYNDEKKLNYTLANDKTTLYAAIRISDRVQQMQTLHGGITLSIDTRGKKKETFSLTFPLAPAGAVLPFAQRKDGDGEVTKEDRDELLRERITQLRNIKVEGFKDIEGDMITTSNTYGIKAAINYDAEGNLIYELAIPLQFFHADDIAKNEWAFNFKINGIQRPKPEGGNENGGGMGGGGRGGRGGGGGGMGGGGGRGGGGGGAGGGRGGFGGGGAGGESGRSDASKSVDFWEKFYLNKN